jgi:signal transduction histidine kinase
MCLPYLVEELESTCARLAQSHEQLASAQERLVHTEKLASMGQLSAGVAHEINNPLGTILIYSHMLLKGLKQQDPNRTDLEMIVGEATRCRNIVRSLLDFARQSRVSKTPTDVAKLIAGVVAVAEPKAAPTNVRVTCDIPPNLPTMMLDETQVTQALVNLVDNGIDAISGGGHVNISARLDEKGRHVEIKVTDTGRGMPRESLSKLFTPFFTTKEMGKGTGLGLAIVYGVVKMHSGDISVESEEGKGSAFTIRLPLIPAEGAESVGNGIESHKGSSGRMEKGHGK